MNIIIVGYGKMGKMVEQIALLGGHKITAIVDPFFSEAGKGGVQIVKTIDEIKIDQSNPVCSNPVCSNLVCSNPVCAIEFTQPDSAVKNIITLAERGIPVVTGTTGWHEHMDDVRRAVEKSNEKGIKSSLLWASNFSIGVNMFYRIAWYAASLANNFCEYDVGGFESHHNKKMDSPSGTAKVLAEGVLSRIERKNKIVWETINRKPEEDEFHFPSLRMGSVPGLHTLFFDSAADTIEITHTARSRQGFASGAVQAALWLAETPKPGVFTIDDMMNDIFKPGGKV